MTTLKALRAACEKNPDGHVRVPVYSDRLTRSRRARLTRHGGPLGYIRGKQLEGGGYRVNFKAAEVLRWLDQLEKNYHDALQEGLREEKAWRQ